MAHQNTSRGEGQHSDTASEAHTSEFAREGNKLPSICVVEAVAETVDDDPTDFGPLYEAIDPEALDTLLGAPHRFQEGHIAFRFGGCDVTVEADGLITVSPE